MDVNPYEPPRESEPQRNKPPVKRAFGAVMILLLTPLAVLIAGGMSCAAAIAIVDKIGDPGFTLAWIVFLAPPALVFVAMIWWAVRASGRR